MGGYLKTSKQVVLRDDYSSYYQQATVDVDVLSDGTVNWKITMKNDRVGSSGRGVYLYVKIGDKVVRSAGYTVYDASGDYRWRTYPTGNGSSDSGSFTTTAESLDITVHICCMQANIANGKKTTETLTRTTWTDIGKGTVTIIDNGDNTFTIGGTKGKDGTNNPGSGPWLYYSYDSATYENSLDSDGDTFKLAGSAKVRTVFAKCVTEATYGSDTEATTSKEIKRYVAPLLPNKVNLTYEKSRLTVKEPWVFTWDAAAQSSSSYTGVKGYRIVLLKNHNSIPIKSSGKTISSNPSSADWYTVDIESNSFTIDPIANGFEPDDVVALGVKPYTINGKSEKVFNSDYRYSTDATVQNAGIARIKVGGNWKEGQVYVKTSTGWKEAETVNVKTSSGWKESQ